MTKVSKSFKQAIYCINSLLLLFTSYFLSPLAFAESSYVKSQGQMCLLTRNLNLEELVNTAGIIFKGKLKSREYIEENDLTVRKLTFEVVDAIAGVREGLREIVLKEWAKTKTPLADKEQIKLNRPYVFFFHEPSELGLTSLVGLEQGLVNLDTKDHLHYSSRLSLNNTAKKKPGLNFLKFFSDNNDELTGMENMNDYKNLKEFCKKKKS